MQALDAIAASNLKWLKGRTIFLTRHGSHAYGTNIATSDEDFKGLAIAPKEYYLGVNQNFEQAEFKAPGPDMVIFELRKFFRLAVDCNPNIIEVLFSDPSDYLLCRPEMEMLLEKRQLFVSKRARHRFAGYAHAQLQRIQGHYRWLKDPPKSQPTRAEYGLPERTVIPSDQLQAAEAVIQKKVAGWNLNLSGIDESSRVEVLNDINAMLTEMFLTKDEQYRAVGSTLGYSDNFLDLLDKERKYTARQKEWKSYQDWKTNRNEKRSELEAKWGYDTKHAMHLVRLLRMCREILETGRVLVKRPDAAELLAIRNGEWTYEQLIEWSAKQDRELGELYKNTNVIPHSPDMAAIDALCIMMVERSLSLG